jgi:capsular polysaccharide biosynthesis protein
MAARMNAHRLKESVQSALIAGINAVGVNSKYLGTPKKMMTVKEWVNGPGQAFDAAFHSLIPPVIVHHPPPITLEPIVHRLFRNEYEYVQPEAFVAVIPEGRVWGRDGAVVAPDDVLLMDVSREFGAYGGVIGKTHSVNKQFTLHKCVRIEGDVAVLAAAGSYCYHHWLYDVLPRIELLNRQNVLRNIDHFVIDYTNLSFQADSLKTLGIPEEKIIRVNDRSRFHIEAERLWVPSLPSRLGTINEWVVNFLRSRFLPDFKKEKARLYISRRKAPSRKLLNEKELTEYLLTKGFIEFFPEDYSIKTTAGFFAAADFVAGVHGSGFANAAFLSQGARLLDIIAPRHLDPYHWMLANHTGATYGYLFGEGDRPKETVDLVKTKIDEDILIDLNKFDQLYRKLESYA